MDNCACLFLLCIFPFFISFFSFEKILNRFLGEPDEEALDGDSKVFTYYTPNYNIFVRIELGMEYEKVLYVAFQLPVEFTDDILNGDSAAANNLPMLPDGYEWVEAPSWTTNSYHQEVITGVIKKTSGDTKNPVDISFNLYDSNGYQVGQAYANITNFSAGSSWKFEAWPTGTSGTIASFEFAALSEI